MDKNRLLAYTAITTMVSVIGFIIYVLFLLFYPITILKANVQPYKVKTPVVQRGGKVIYEVDACKFRDYQGSVTRFFQTENLIVASEVTIGSILQGCAKKDIVVEVPSAMLPGEYNLFIRVVYDINVLRKETLSFTTEKFRIE